MKAFLTLALTVIFVVVQLNVEGAGKGNEVVRLFNTHKVNNHLQGDIVLGEHFVPKTILCVSSL